MTSITDLRRELRDAYLAILLPIRGTHDKVVPREAGRRLLAIADQFVQELQSQELIEKDLVGELYFPFLQMLAEADHATDPDPLLNFAWSYQDRLDSIFGPYR